MAKVNTRNRLGYGVFVAHPARFERAAFRLGGERSILLSYGCMRPCRAHGLLCHDGALLSRYFCRIVLPERTLKVES